MPRFRFEALDPLGRRHQGEREASGPDELAARLAEEDLRLESADPINGPGPKPTPIGGRDELTDAEAAEFAGQLGDLAASGRALPDGLRALAAESGSRRVREALGRVADMVEAGFSLDQAIAEQGRRFPEHLRGIALAAARSGRMAHVLAETVRFERIGASLRWQLLLRLAYPALLLSAFFELLVLCSLFVVPDFEAIYLDFGIELPAVTVWLIHVSRAMGRVGWAAQLAVPGTWLLVWLAARGMTRSARRRVASWVPLFGGLWRNAALAEFAQLLALLIDGSLPLPEALVLAGRGVRDVDLVGACRGAAKRVEQGAALAEAVEAYRLFPRGFNRLIGWAEAHGLLPEALRMVAEVLEARARSQAVLLGLFAVAAASVIVVLGVFLMVSGLYLPMIRLISELAVLVVVPIG